MRDDYEELNRKLRAPAPKPPGFWFRRISGAVTFVAWVVGVFQITSWVVPDRIFAALGPAAIVPFLALFWFCGMPFFNRKLDP